MHNTLQPLGKWDRLCSKQNIVYWAFAWAALSLFTYIFFSGSAGGVERPFWYRIFTAYFLQNVPTLVAGILCIRNGLSRRMPSGRQVWLLMGIALISYLIGNIFFSSWELVWQLNSTGSLGDPFFVIFYFCLSLAILTAITSKRVRLQMYQWSIILGIVTYAVMIAMWILKPPATSAEIATPVAVEIIQTTTSNSSKPAPTAPIIVAPSEPEVTAPGWVMFFDGIFKPYGSMLNNFYVWSDVFLLVLAVMMILGFWGGKLSNAWQFNAQAIACYYVADMWFAYAGNHVKDYQGGFTLEVFWILGAIQFAIAAGVEFEHMLARQYEAEILTKLD
jgi:hypothetical protein